MGIASTRRPRIGVTAGAKPGWKPAGRYWAPYARAVEDAVAEAVWIGPETFPGRDPDAFDRMLQGLDGLLLSGGADLLPNGGVFVGIPPEDDPGHRASVMRAHIESEAARDAYEIPLARKALDLDMPVLGICRGFQLLNVVCGGRLIPDLRTGWRHRAYSEQVSAAHLIDAAPDSWIESLEGPGYVPINSRHHQGVSADLVAPGLRATASAPDGIVEALEDPRRPWRLAVQWHPERPEDAAVRERDRRIFGAFVDECKRR